MPIKIEIVGDSQDDINALMKHFIKVDPYKCALDDLLDIARRRFKEAGFAIEVKAIAGEPQGVPTPAEAEAIVEKIEKKLAKKSTTAKKPTDAARAADADKTYVVEEMVKRFGDPRQKLKAKAFIDTVTGRHGSVRLSLLDPALFPDIRTEMEAEFGIVKTSNGAGSEAHA